MSKESKDSKDNSSADKSPVKTKSMLSNLDNSGGYFGDKSFGTPNLPHERDNSKFQTKIGDSKINSLLKVDEANEKEEVSSKYKTLIEENDNEQENLSMSSQLRIFNEWNFVIVIANMINISVCLPMLSGSESES